MLTTFTAFFPLDRWGVGGGKLSLCVMIALLEVGALTNTQGKQIGNIMSQDKRKNDEILASVFKTKEHDTKTQEGAFKTIGKTIGAAVLSSALLGPAVASAQSFNIVSKTQLSPKIVKVMEDLQMNVPRFIFMSTKSDFRDKYFDNIELLKEDFNITKMDFEAITSIDLNTLEDIIVIDHWEDLSGLINGEHTIDNYNNHMKDLNPDHNNYTNSHDKSTSGVDDFRWEELLEQYTLEAPQVHWLLDAYTMKPLRVKL